MSQFINFLVPPCISVRLVGWHKLVYATRSDILIIEILIAVSNASSIQFYLQAISQTTTNALNTPNQFVYF